MPIVHQSAPALFTSPPVYLLPAPPKRLALPAPKIVGYLPAPKSAAASTRQTSLYNQNGRQRKTGQTVVPEVADSLENLVLNCPNFDDLLEAIGPIRPAAELEAEFAAVQARIEDRFQQLYRQLAVRSPRGSWFTMWKTETESGENG